VETSPNELLPNGVVERYIVSMFGTISDWVHNIDAAHGDAVNSHGGAQRVRLVLAPPTELSPVLREYVRIASHGRKHSPLPVGAPLADFAAIAPQYPVCRIEVPLTWTTTIGGLAKRRVKVNRKAQNL
jgi:hypothetical protein